MQLTVHVNGGRLTLDPATYTWSADAGAQSFLPHVELITSLYRYDVADGQPGYALATQVAEAVGGRTELPPAPPLPEGAVA